MYIPVWIIVFVIVVYVLGRATNEDFKALGGCLLGIFYLALVVSFGIAIYLFFFEEELWLAVLFASPAIAVGIWAGYKEEKHEEVNVREELTDEHLERIKRIIKRHKKKVKNLGKDYKAIENERKELERMLNLGEALYNCYDDVQYYPSWHENSKKNNKEKWHSKIISPEKLYKEEFSKIKSLFKDIHHDYEKDDELLILEFKSDNDDYKIIYNTCNKWNDLFGEADGDMTGYYECVIFKNDKKLVLHAHLDYMTKYADYYNGIFLKAFKPDDWVLALIIVLNALHIEYRKSADESTKKLLDKSSKKNFVDD